MAKTVVGGSPANSIATKHGSKVVGMGKSKSGKGKKAGFAHGPVGKKM